MTYCDIVDCNMVSCGIVKRGIVDYNMVDLPWPCQLKGRNKGPVFGAMATAAAVVESRGELLSWVNDLLQLNLTKIEQVGTGAAISQIFDSIYGDVPLSKLKFNTHLENDYVQNFKVLQATFDRHNIDKHVPVERLIKLKFQDNLEFLQWVKKFWDANYPGGSYDALGRRGAKGAASTIGSASGKKPPTAINRCSLPASQMGALRASTISSSPANLRSTSSPPHNNSKPPISSQSAKSKEFSLAQPNVAELTKNLTELSLTVDEMERERDFYFGKLRDIEIITQSIADPAVLGSELFKRITEILYKTEEGFEIPADDDLPTGTTAMTAITTTVNSNVPTM